MEAIGDKQRLGDLQFGDTLSNKREMTLLKNQRVMYKICKSQGSHSTWKTWKNESTPGKPGNIMEF